MALEPPEERQHRAPAPSVASSAPSGSGLHVLIVDGDPDSRVALRRAIQRAEVAVAGEVGYGTDAVSLAVEVKPDAIFLAVEEPAVRALDTAEGIANALPETPIMLVSSRGDVESVRRGMLVGARDYLVKPVDANRVRESLNLALTYEERRQMRRAGQLAGINSRGTVITVSGAKGGVGKSVVSTNLALALATETGRSVAIIDADTQFGDIATFFDLSPHRTVKNLIDHRGQLDRTNVREFVTSHLLGVDILAGAEDEDAWYRCSGDDVKNIIDAFARVYDFVVVDTAGSFDPFVRTCIEASTLTLVVSSGEVSSVRDTAAAVRRLERWGVADERVRYVLNEARADASVGPERFARALDREVFWVIPYDRAAIESVQVGQPVVLARGSRAGASLRGLAQRIAGQSTWVESKPARESLWRRVLPLKGDRNDDPALGSVASPAVRR